MKTVLIPTDFSENGYNAVRYGVQLFGRQPCTFILLNTFLPAGMNTGNGINFPVPITADDYDEQNSLNGLKRTLSKINGDFSGLDHHFETISSLNLLVEAIMDQIAERSIDLIIMGTQGATGARELFLGSTTQKVISGINNCPLLVIPSKSEYRPWHHIGFATNFDRHYKKWQIAPLKAFTNLQDSTIKIVHVLDRAGMSDGQLRGRGELDALLDGVKKDHLAIENHGSIEKTIMAAAQEMGVDVLALIHYKHGFLEQLIREPVVKRINFHTGIPLLVLPQNDRLPRTKAR